MASATMTTLLKPSLCKISTGAFAFSVAPPVTRTSAISMAPAQLKRESHACFVTIPTPPRFSLRNLMTCEMDKFGGRRGKTGRRSSSSIRCSRIDILNSPETLRWLFAVSSVVLMLSKNTGIHKSFLVPLLALQAPGEGISWIRGEYGLWTAFVVFLVRLFYPIPGEMELPLLFVLLVIIAPYQAMNLRGTQAGMVISIAIAAYLSFQHITRSGGLKGAFEQRNLVASIAALCLICVPCWFLIQGFIF